MMVGNRGSLLGLRGGTRLDPWNLTWVMPAEGGYPTQAKPMPGSGVGEMDEWQLLERIARRVPRAGDDCAVYPWGDTHLVVTLDMLHRNADFPWATSPYTIGWRSVAVSLSDVASMGARPLVVLLGLSAPALDMSFVDEVLEGAQACCAQAGGELSGGDLDRSQELFLASCALGTCTQPVLRKGARVGDLLCVSGPLGSTARAMELLDGGQHEEGNVLFRFLPRTELGQKLAGLATSMLDISDGLAHSVHLLANASQVGFRVDAQRIPWIDGLRAPALDYGEDFELLFTLPEKAFRPGLGTVIGEAVPHNVTLVESDGEQPLHDRGYDHGR